MPKSSRAELAELRAQTMERDGGCRWPGCEEEIHDFGNPLQMAHLNHRGMGGSIQANTLDNTLILCSRHHDCLDGRTGLGTLKLELVRMLRYVNHIF